MSQALIKKALSIPAVRHPATKMPFNAGSTSGLNSANQPSAPNVRANLAQSLTRKPLK